MISRQDLKREKDQWLWRENNINHTIWKKERENQLKKRMVSQTCEILSVRSTFLYWSCSKQESGGDWKFILRNNGSVQFSSVTSLSCIRLFATPWIAAHQASLSITNSWSSLRLTSIESVMPSSHLILCHPLLLLPPIPPSIRVFSNESTLHMRWPKYWSFSLSIIPSKKITVKSIQNMVEDMNQQIQEGKQMPNRKLKNSTPRHTVVRFLRTQDNKNT